MRRAADALAARIPAELAPFARLAYNYRWSWHPDGPGVFEAISPHRWRVGDRNPVRLLQETSTETLVRAAADTVLVARATRLEEELSDVVPAPSCPVAYFCAEYAIHQSLPIYSGGLGVLAGDFLKEASDAAMDMVGVGLMYRQGYFRQRIDAAGGQHEYWVETDPSHTPAALVSGPDGSPVLVTVPVCGGEVTVRVWRVEVGRVPLYLLDADCSENDLIGRWSTGRLYTGDPEMRLAQYALLGVGGMRVLAALGIEPALVHLNEGHAAFGLVEDVRARMDGEAPGELGRAWDAARGRTVFTTHTPVAAGNDTYSAELITGAFGVSAAAIGLSGDELLRLGRTRPDDVSEPFGITQFALRTSRAANAVSARHGEVAREMWRGLWADRPVDGVPIGHVTNGIHIPTWIGGPMRALLARHLGEDWRDPAAWEALEAIGDAELWAARGEQRRALVSFVRDRSVAERLDREETREYVTAADRAFDPHALTIGFARRLATYKRLDLLLVDVERALRLLRGDAPIQIVLAGKAHPRDEDGKQLLRSVFRAKGLDTVGDRVVYLADYDLAVGAQLVQGCDVWVNLPRPPLEASGTSGMKAAINGGLNLSVLDGWWAEAYDGRNGWAISGEIADDHAAQDASDSAELYGLLERVVVPEFHDRDEAGLPRAWLRRIRASLRCAGTTFSTTRMLGDYRRDVYGGL